jgi:D-sedoheptulose 7-phosphate isomerase
MVTPASKDHPEGSSARLADDPQRVAAGFFDQLRCALEHVRLDELTRAAELMELATLHGGRMYVMGNGGSASTASHLVCDLSKAGLSRPVRAFALTDSAPLVTALANDTSYERVFAAQLGALLDPGDVVFAISASGASRNLLAGLEVARQANAPTIGLLGFDGGPMLRLVDVALHVDCDDYGIVETIHLGIVHALVAIMRRER